MTKMTGTRRKLAIATWTPATEGNIFGKVTIDVSEAVRYISHVKETTGERVSITHLVGKAAGQALAKTPTLNGKILFSRFVPFDTVDITYLIASDGDLAKAKIENVDQKTVIEIAHELRERAAKVRSGEDKEFKKSMDAVRMMPMFILRPMIRFTGWLSGALGVSLKALGVERHAFGSCVVTSVGMLGFDEGYAPFTPFARVPLLLLVGAIREKPTVVDGEVVVRPLVTITATVDHRFIDGAQLGTLAKEFRKVLEHPFELESEGPSSLESQPAS